MARKKIRKNYYLPLRGVLVEVSREVYEAFYELDRRERYLEERDQDKGLLHFSDYDTVNSNFTDYVEDTTVDVEKIVETGMVIRELYAALDGLNSEERGLIEQLFFKEFSMREIARREQVSHVAIQKRRNRVLLKLREILKDIEA